MQNNPEHTIKQTLQAALDLLNNLEVKEAVPTQTEVKSSAEPALIYSGLASGQIQTQRETKLAEAVESLVFQVSSLPKEQDKKIRNHLKGVLETAFKFRRRHIHTGIARSFEP